MTRETKIGLLVGLGFIVVFAVLLSHTGSAPPSAGLPSMAEGSQPTSAVMNGDLRATMSRQFPSGGTDLGTTGTQPESGVAIDTHPLGGFAPAGQDLPSPDLFNPTLVGNAGDDGSRTASGRSSDGVPPDAVARVRMAPQPSIDEPKMTPRPDPPQASPAPETGKTAPLRLPPREHIVRKGENLGEIASERYGTSKPSVVQFVVKANAGQVKDANSIIEGQKLLLPDLPPELFEVVGTIDVRTPASGIRRVSLQELRDAEPSASPRHAPPPSKTTAANQPVGSSPLPGSRPPAWLTQKDVNLLVGAPPSDKGKTTQGDEGRVKGRRAPDDKSASRRGGTELVKADDGDKFRWHEVKPKDTFASIAKDQLGSANLWPEIKKLNPDLDPMKIKPGDKIKLPTQRSSSRGNGGKDSRQSA